MLWNLVQILFCTKMFFVTYTCLYSLMISYLHTTHLGHLSLSLIVLRIPHHISLTTACISFLSFIYLLSESNSIAHVCIVWGQPLENWELTSSHTLKYQWFSLLNNHKVPISLQVGVGSQEPLPLCWNVYLAWFVQVFEWVIIAALEFTRAIVMSNPGQHFTILFPSSCSYILSASSSMMLPEPWLRAWGWVDKHEEWRKPREDAERVDGVLSGCTLLTWAWPCQGHICLTHRNLAPPQAGR